MVMKWLSSPLRKGLEVCYVFEAHYHIVFGGGVRLKKLRAPFDTV